VEIFGVKQKKNSRAPNNGGVDLYIGVLTRNWDLKVGVIGGNREEKNLGWEEKDREGRRNQIQT